MKIAQPIIACMILSLAACVPTVDMPADETESGASMSAVSTPAVSVSTGTLLIGRADAPVTMLLFTNYDCAYCRDFEYTLMPRLQTDFIDKGTLNVRVIALPLQKYADSDRNAQLLLCGTRAGSGADVHRQLFADRNDFPALKTCLDDAAYLQREMAAQHALITTLNVTLVPTYVLDGQIFTGLPTYADLRGQIRNALE